MNPIELFNNWYLQELSNTKIKLPSACCLSTFGMDGFPNARFVSLKEVVEDNFVVTGSMASRKGEELSANNKVALTFWWIETKRQVRIQGYAKVINEKLAGKYFKNRNKESQIVSIVSKQGQELHDIDELHKKYREVEINSTNKSLKRPADWSGYFIEPVRIEFLEFNETRFHNRVLYSFQNGVWKKKLLQP